MFTIMLKYYHKEGCDDGSFEVMVGSWVNSYPKCKSLIRAEFDLPSDAKFLEDSHWNIGSGWEGDK